MQVSNGCFCNHYQEYLDLRRDVEELQSKLALSAMKFGVHMIAENDEKTLFYTGLPTYYIFKDFFDYLEPKAGRMQYWRGNQTKVCPTYHQLQCDKPRPERTMALIDEYFAVLARLRLGLLLEDIE